MNPENSTKKRSFFYWHSEGLSFQPTGGNELRVNSANLVDFLISVSTLAFPAIISGPHIRWNGILTLPTGSNLVVADGKLNLSTRLKLFFTLPAFLLNLLFGDLSTHLKNSAISVSVGLSGTGTIIGCVRAIYFKKQHAFIVRGDRLTTVRNSSRAPLNRVFVMLRIRLYNWTILQLVKSGRAEIWFQGRAHHQLLVSKLPKSCTPRLKVLDAVLRDLPAIDENIPVTYDLIFTGRITIEKGLLELISALEILSQKGLKLSLCVVGDGPDKDQISQAANKADVADQIDWKGYISDPAEIVRLLTASRIFVLPSYTEGLPRSLLEAAALGLPCITTPVGGIPFLFTHAESIFLVPVKDSQALADQIKIIHLAEISCTLDGVKEKAKELARSCSFKKKAEYFYTNACRVTK